MQIAICEDSVQIMANIEQIITRFFDRNSIDVELDTFLSGERLLNYLSKHPNERYHLYLLDIEMGEINGMEVAEKIRETDKEALIIFITSHDEFMIKAFDVSAFHFLIKPVDPIKLKAVLQKSLSTIKRRNNVFVYRTNKKTFTILYSNIQYFESDKRKINIFTNTNTYTFYGTMKNIENILPNNFAQIHKSYLVNLDHIELVEGRQVQMSTGEVLIISRSNVDAFYDTYRKFVIERMG